MCIHIHYKLKRKKTNQTLRRRCICESERKIATTNREESRKGISQKIVKWPEHT